MMVLRLLLLSAATFLVVGSTATAGLLVDAFAESPTSPDTTRTDAYAQVGFGFYATANGIKQVNQLGFWVSPDNPGGVLATDHEVALYSYNGTNYTQIAAATILAGTTADANGYAWASIPLITLTDTSQGGDYYIVTASVGTDIWTPSTGSANAGTIDAGFGTRTANGWFSAAAAPGVGGTASFSRNSNGGYFGPNAGLSLPPIFISDTFTGASNGAAITGTVPDTVNVPGVSWIKPTSRSSLMATQSAGFGDSLPGVFGQSQNASAIALDGGAFTSPAIIELTVDLKLNPQGNAIAGSASDGRGLALGFYDSVGNWQYSQNHFTGLVLDAAGNLNLVQDLNDTGFFATGSTLETAIAYGGTFDPTQFYTLSYTIDRNTGSILDISLSGSTADYSPFYSTALFTSTVTNYAGLYVSSAASGTYGAFDNFSVTVPEPSALLILLGIAGTGLLSGPWRRNRRR